MSSDYCFLLAPSDGHSSTVISFQVLMCLIAFVLVFAFWLTPGGLAWAHLRDGAGHRMGLVGPSGLPFVGLVFVFMNSVPHRILARISQTFKASFLMCFSVGCTRFVVSSSPEAAKEMLNSSAFADRPVKESAYGLLFHRAMGFAPYGEYWRNLRRISSAHLFSPKMISCFGVFREEIGLKMVEEIRAQMRNKGEIEVKNVLHFGSLNNVMMSVFGKFYDFCGSNGDGVELEELVKEGYELLGVFNWGDHFSFLRWLDLQGIRKRCGELVGRVNVFVEKIIEEHRVRRLVGKNDGTQGCDENPRDFVDVLLDLDTQNRLSDSDMIAVLWEMIFRGTDTVAILLEWTLARMVLHPEIQARAQDEINTVIGTKRTVADSDLPNLPYLLAILKETLRVHPPGPLLSWARLAVHDTYVGPHFIPAGTTAMVNMWAITHDDKIWPEPEKFRPERFLAEDVPIMGSDLRLAPFGAGRRVCPGKAMGLATAHLWLAQLLQNFKWIASHEHGVDLTERLKLSMEMKKPLICKAVPRTP